MPKGRVTNYINNKSFLAALIAYKQECKDSVAKGGTNRPSTKNYDYIGKCMMLIAEKMMNRGNFNGYSYKDEMILDSISDCVARIDNFNPEKSQNPFSFYSQIVWNCAIRRIKSEAKQKNIKIELLKNSNILQEVSGDISPEDDDYACYQENVKSLLSCLEPEEKKPLDKALVKRNKSYSKKLKQMDIQIDQYEKDLYKDLDVTEEVISDEIIETEE